MADKENGFEELVIFYFSGTGNTWWVSEELVSQFTKLDRSARAYSIETLSVDEASKLISNSEIVGFGYPIHGSDLPKPMKSFISQLPSESGKRAFVFCTQWLWSGDGAAVGGTMLHDKGFKIQWGEHFLMPNNVTVSIISLPYTNDHSRLAGVLGRSARRAASLAEGILAGKAFLRGFNQLSFYFGSLQRIPFRKVFHKLQNDIGIDFSNCIDCGECVRLCPVDNFYYEDRLIKTKGSCIICLRCYNFCPVAAITHMDRPHLHGRGEPYKGPVKDFDPTVLIERKFQ